MDYQEKLQELIKKIQELQPDSTEYDKALNKLKELISPELLKLCRLKGKYITWHEDLRAEACFRTINKIPEIVKKYDPSKGRTVMGWFKGAYRLELSNLVKKFRKTQEDSLDLMADETGFEPSANENNEIYGSFNECVEKSPRWLREQIKHCIEQNYNGFFDSIKPILSKNGGSIALPELLLMRLEDKPFKEISAEFGISIKTLSSSIKRHEDQIKSYITEHTGIAFEK